MLPGVGGAELENIRGEDGGQNVARLAHPLGGLDGLLTGAGGQVQNAAARTDPSQVEHDLGGRSQPGIQQGPPAMPSLRRGLPLLAGRRLVLHRIELR